MNSIKVVVLYVSLMFAVVLLGCTTTSNGPIDSGPFIDDSNPRATLILGSKKLLNKVKIMNPRFRVLGQLTQAEVTVQNLSENRYTLEYKCDWYASEGSLVNSLNVWNRFTLTPHQTQSFQFMGKTPEAVKIVFTVRFPDDVFIENYKQRNK
ncbi:MAG: DUF1425 domain-containing protein [Candidatus Schekmanbacteria bacterium]|nr:MAG: DUF1425 domain-containing protein [Candidatus Schekmanbacteria bacterium]